MRTISPTRQSPRIARVSPRRSPRLSPAKPKNVWKPISSFLKPLSPRTKARKHRERRAQEKARREKAAIEAAAKLNPPSPAPPKRAPRNKAERKRARGRSSSDSPSAKPPAKKQKTTANPPGPKPRKKYAPPDPAILTEAVAYYDQKKAEGDPQKKAAVAKKFGLERKTFSLYAHDDPNKRMTIGSKPGRPSNVSAEDREFLVQVTVRADKANEGLRPRDVIENLVRLTAEDPKPLSDAQAKTYVYKSLRKDPRLTNKLVIAQKTSSKRSSTDVAAQWRWFQNFVKCLDFLRRENTGVCRRTGKTFGELIDHFVVGADEACLMTDNHGSVRVFGSTDKKKHERNASDHRASITMYRSGVTSGHNGPTAFLMKGKKKRPGFTDKFLVEHGCEPGSTVVMTENSFMTNAAWIEISKKIVEGYRKLPYVVDNPQWWVLELVDGFNAHIFNHEANVDRFDKKVLSLKEEGDSSHINQAYDRLVARSDKAVNREALIWMQRDKVSNAHTIDQWDLLSCGLATVRHTRDNPSIWSNSFKATNTKPTDMVDFVDWIKKIESHLFASDSFELRDVVRVDKYSLLPGFWQAFTPEEKRKAVAIVTKYGGNAWGYDCCSELSKELSVPFKDMNQLQTCIFCAIEDPSHLDRGVEEDAPVPLSVPEEVAAAEEARTDATAGLSHYRLKPDGVTGEALLKHMYEFGQEQYGNKESEYGVSKYLDVDYRTPHQQNLMKVNYKRKIMANIMDDVNAGISKRKAIKTRLNYLGQVGGHSAIVNDTKTNELNKFRLNLMMSQAHAEELGQKEKATKKKAAQNDLQETLPEALYLYAKGEYGRALTKLKIEAILSLVFLEDMPGSKHNKPAMLEKLHKLAEESPGKVFESIGKHPYDPSNPPPLPPPAAATSSPAASVFEEPTLDEMNDFFSNDNPAEQPVQDLATTATGTGPAYTGGATCWRRWLLCRCSKAVADMKMNCTSYKLAELIVELVEEVRVFGKDNYKEMNMIARLGSVILSNLRGNVDDKRELMKAFRTEVEQNMLAFVNSHVMTAEGLKELM